MTGFHILPDEAALDLSLPCLAYRLLGILATHGDANGYCWPSQGRLATLLGVDRRTIINHIRTLVERGYLLRQEQHVPGQGQTVNRYQVLRQRRAGDVGFRDPSPPVNVESPPPDPGFTPPREPGFTQNQTHSQPEAAAARAPEAAPIEEEWTPGDEALAYAAKHHPGIPVLAEAAKFLRHYRRIGKRSADWDGEFMRWLPRAEKEWAGAGPASAAAPDGARASARPGRPLSQGMAALERMATGGLSR